ncbi:hypothetical protein A9179_18765 [Pseudomonas alcaligenes]|uniref:Solute-binding protein family 3/N-terminal domain-containing protein n=1 Tax=Aquipseudomonas alcaligenes TaxID=43263 RepID=A0ABR7S792_AQUAC|nr:hypothetical protein [Pseudomonas alcaligenes]MBC9252318.1 hypothetical protein [Pseudomonas alcaligenes]
MRLLALLFACVLGLSLRVSACEISLIYSIDPIPPLVMGDGEQIPEHPGTAIELLQRAAGDIGCTLLLKRAPTLRVLASVESGSQDGAFIYAYNAERAARFAYPLKDGAPDAARRLTSLAYVIYHRRGTTLDWDGQRLSGLDKPLGINRGWSIGEDLRADGIAVEEASSTWRNLAKLRAGRLAGYVSLREAGDEALRHYQIEDVERMPLPFVTKDYFVIFNRDFQARNPQLLERLWSRIGQLREATLAELALKYQTIKY